MPIAISPQAAPITKTPKNQVIKGKIVQNSPLRAGRLEAWFLQVVSKILTVL